jgi:ferrous iron transport protein B
MTALLPWEATLLWFAVVTLVMITVGSLSARILPGAKSDFILELPPLRLPQISNIISKTLARIEWYLKEVIPIFIAGTLILFFLDRTGALIWIEKLAAPVIQEFLGLPVKATESFLIGFLRRDYGAAGLFNLASQGLLNNNQIVISIITITLFIPCIANFLMIIKELGLKIALAIALFIVPFAFGVGGMLNFILNLTGVKF